MSGPVPSALDATSAWGRAVVDEARAALAGKPVLVTGASGFIGGRLRDALIDLGADVVAVRRASSPPPPRGRSVVAEYADAVGLERVVREVGPEIVLHVAGVTKGVTLDDFRRGNLVPTENLLRAVRAARPGLRRFVQFSSLAAYGPTPPGTVIGEDAPRRPVEFYGQSKLEAELAVEASGEALPWTILRPGGVYGPGDVDYLELFKPVEKGLNPFFGNARIATSMVYVDDLVRATLAAAIRRETIGRGYFVSDGAPITFAELQSAIVAASGRRALTLNLPSALVGLAARAGELATKLDGKPRLFNRQKAEMGKHCWTCRADALAKDTGYTPEVLVPEGVRRTLAWYRANRWV